MTDLPHILLVDDNRQDLDLIQEACADAGVRAIFHLSGDGRDAIRFLTRLELESVTLDLVVLDLFLPGKDGFSVLQHIQGKERLRAMPVLVMTSSGDMRHVERCFKLGADFYLWKPTMYDDYRAVANRIAELLDARPRPIHPVATVGEREESLWSQHSPERWAGLGG